MVLKDKGNLVKQYALVDVKKYSIVATGTTQKDTLASYRKLISQNGISVNQGDKNLEDIYDKAEVTVKDIKYVNGEEGTFVYITDTEGNVYKAQFTSDETLIFIQVNDKVEFYYELNEDTGIRNIESWKFTQETQAQPEKETVTKAEK